MESILDEIKIVTNEYLALYLMGIFPSKIYEFSIFDNFQPSFNQFILLDLINKTHMLVKRAQSVR